MNGYVLITGASRGLGYELLKKFHTKNYFVFPLVRNDLDAKKIRSEFTDRCHLIQTDISLDSSKKTLEKEVTKFTDKLDIVINNAGIPGKEFEIAKVDLEEINELFNIHCLGVIRTVQATLPYLQKSLNPRIINVSSRLGSLSKMASDEFKNRKFSYSYRIAKASQNMLTICLHNELNPIGIHISAIHPGRLKTQSGASDANKEPFESAESIYEWIQTLNRHNSNQYVEPGIYEFQW
ncbi:SDR family NAD(P)-dependent oxidoreductase [Bacillus thuringiensis]|nr:SDR family NAD(P)-dependent oxidoreductase [Bacillus thuringiensis]MED3632925.1 SDR family NAD(P)-dependent oxidoreductase [Bacillus thuringiensis]